MALPQSVIDARQSVVETIIEDMQRYQFNWTEQWRDALSPRNALTGRLYRGGNLLHLAAAARRNGYKDPRWVSFKQAKDNGWKIKKGSKGARIEYWKLTGGLIETETEDGETQINAFRRRPVCVGTWTVFNGSCIEGIPELDVNDPSKITDGHLFDLSDEIMASSRCPISEDSNTAYYSPTTDSIHLPDRYCFDSAQAFLRTTLHEMAHSSGHPSALDRDLSGHFGSDSYAFEELIAELSSGFTVSSLGLPFGDVDRSHYEAHVAYLESWIHSMKEDSSVLFKAASKASAASDYILDRYRDK